MKPVSEETGLASAAPGLEPPARVRDAPGAGSAEIATGSDGLGAIDRALDRAEAELLRQQAPDGHWCFELEADCTIPSEYILLMHFLGEIEEPLQGKLAAYVRARQADHGGWSLYQEKGGAELDVSCSVKAYWALKLAGDSPDAPHMRAARKAILSRGGAARCNVFTRITMALFRQVPWRAVPFVPVEIVLFPPWFPFHLRKVSYWTRTVLVPLSILCSLRARAQNPTGITIRELFRVPPEEERDYFPVRSRLNALFLAIERSMRLLEPTIPGKLRGRALREAERWIVERLNGLDGLGAIFPAMVNAVESLLLLGYPRDHEHVVRAREALGRLVVERGESAYCQPCVSPVWDTALGALALEEAVRARPPSPQSSQGNGGADSGQRAALERTERARAWLRSKQILDGPADWKQYRPDLEPGGWAFQYENPHYPDIDDTSAAIWALAGSGSERYAEPIRRGLRWIRGMQSRCGGFGAFDADNTAAYLNEIPFADHGALLDPPTADVSARCALALALEEGSENDRVLRRALDYVLAEQEPNGSWYGRWGTNYVYGTWSVLAALERVEERLAASGPRNQAACESIRRAQRKAVRWLRSVQREDGSWGETNASYERPELAGKGSEGTPFQTAWALLGLLAAGEGDSREVARGVEHLVRTQVSDGLWHCEHFTAPGFPRVFYLRYHGYSAYFPLWALARYRRHLGERTASGAKVVSGNGQPGNGGPQNAGNGSPGSEIAGSGNAGSGNGGPGRSGVREKA